VLPEPMAEKIRYDDNFFFLTALIRALSDGVKLGVDADLFSEKILEDTFFIDSTIQRLYSSLNENPHLIRRDSYLHSIMILKKAYSRLLEDLLAAEGIFSAQFESMRPKLRRIAAAHLNDVGAIREGIETVRDARIDSDTISYDELHFLMSPIEDGPDT
jgi:hypothetical protein